MDLGDLQRIGELVLLGLGTLSVLLHGVAKATKTKTDDKAADWTDKVQNALRWVLVPRKLLPPKK